MSRKALQRRLDEGEAALRGLLDDLHHVPEYPCDFKRVGEFDTYLVRPFGALHDVRLPVVKGYTPDG